MIRISAVGGLGNQLFIWNLAHFLEKKYQQSVKIYYPKTGTDRICEVSNLADFCDHDIKIIQSNRLVHGFGFLNRLRGKSLRIGNVLIQIFSLVQTNLPADSFNFTNKRPRFINGYFQSSKLVEENWHLYSHELLGATSAVIENSEFKDSEILVRKMIHIRRGDFIENRETVGLLSIEYFLKQVKQGEKITILTDAESCDREIETKFPNALIFGGDSVDTWTSFSLLSHASYLVTSNSTFSWWAGVLSEKRGGQVIAPQPWTLTNVYGENYLEYARFEYRESIFEEVNPWDDFSWK
jgi:hypothetical protein